MSTQVRLRGGTTAEHSSFTGAEREVTVDTTLDTLVVHDGVTAGGITLAKLSDVSSPPGAINASNINTTGDITSGNDITAANEVNTPTVDLGGGFKVTRSGGKLIFTYNGSNVFSVNSSGNMIASGNVTAYGSP
tara:strand:- start:692 stop:1093 length:402 start_codon:yes stop_codon:yes gene_type:complete